MSIYIHNKNEFSDFINLHKFYNSLNFKMNLHNIIIMGSDTYSLHVLPSYITHLQLHIPHMTHDIVTIPPTISHLIYYINYNIYGYIKKYENYIPTSIISLDASDISISYLPNSLNAFKLINNDYFYSIKNYKLDKLPYSLKSLSIKIFNSEISANLPLFIAYIYIYIHPINNNYHFENYYKIKNLYLLLKNIKSIYIYNGYCSSVKELTFTKM